ncbi:MAG TPA: protein-L-isoaspartate(D-aspartate) O-methyltransferase [Kofleriaceae bacterium]|nr:protein-L-isoaspartate(D-aspartate) O-methyltransferase [Kofleriaceae bacterium]
MTAHAEADPLLEQRNWMVDHTIVDRGIRDPRVITAMRLTPRHAFVPPAVRDQAYDDRALPIGFESTVSQPYIIALMTEAAHVKAGDKVLEVGTGSGYHAAVLAMMGATVFTIEIRDGLAARTRDVLKVAGFGQVTLKSGDGYFGIPDEAPFDSIIVTCAAPEVPKPLLEQLKVGGRLVMPVGDTDQAIMAITRTPSGTTREIVMDGVLFGPMTGEIETAR